MQLTNDQRQELEQQARDLVAMFEQPGWTVVRAYALQKLENNLNALKKGNQTDTDERMRGRIDVLEWITKGVYDMVKHTQELVNADVEVESPPDAKGDPYSDPQT